MASNTNAAAAGGAAAQQACILWRDTSVGMALMDSLDELIESGHIPPQLAQKVVAQVCHSHLEQFRVLTAPRSSTNGQLKSSASIKRNAQSKQSCTSTGYAMRYDQAKDRLNTC